MAYTLLDGPDATARTPLLIIFAAVLASIAITLSGVSVRGVDKANDRIDNVYLHMQSASAAQSTESSPSVKYIEAQPQVDQSSYLRHIAQTTYSRASTLLTAHPVCRDSPDAYATCMDTLSASEHLMAHQIIANKSEAALALAVQNEDLAVGHATPFLIHADGKFTQNGDLSTEVSEYLSDLSNCRYTLESSVCMMHFNISGTPHLAVLWGNLAGDDARRGFTGNRAALGMSMGGGALTGALSGAGLGAAVGSAVPGIGTVAGGVVGGACGALVGGAGAGLSYAGSHWH